MSDRLFSRRATLIIQQTTPVYRNIGPAGAPVLVGHSKGGTALSIEGLRVQFTVAKALTKNPNSAEISVFNLAKKSRAAIHEQGLGVLLQAGYEDNQAVIFSGLTREIDFTTQGPDIITKIRSGDATSQLNTPVSQSFKPGTTMADVAKTLIGSMGAQEGNLPDFASEMSEQYVSGASLHGAGGRNLQWVLAKAGLTYSIQDGRVQVLKPDGSTKQEAYKLSADTGLLGSPEHGVKPKKGKPRLLKVKSLLLPQLMPGRRIVMDSKEIKGTFVVQKLTHRGDTHEGDWVSEMEVVEVKG
jgi:hypothetical protein